MFISRLNFLPRLIFLIVFSVVMAMPFLWMLSTSLKAEYQVLLYPPRWIPSPIQWQNFGDVFVKAPFVVWFGNTLLITGVSLVGTLFTASLVAYGFSRIQFWGRNFLFILLLSTMMLPDVVTLIPTFILFSRLGWVDTFLPLIVPFFFGGTPFYIFLIRQYLTTIPFDLEEAAFIDGASTFTVFWRIILPLAKPVLGTVGLFSFLSNWNDFMRPMIYLNSPEKKDPGRRSALLPEPVGYRVGADDGRRHHHDRARSHRFLLYPTLFRKGHRPVRTRRALKLSGFQPVATSLVSEKSTRN